MNLRAPLLKKKKIIFKTSMGMIYKIIRICFILLSYPHYCVYAILFYYSDILILCFCFLKRSLCGTISGYFSMRNCF